MESVEKPEHEERDHKRGIDCPLCGEYILHEVRDGVHTWACTECPFVGIESY